ncbi:MAG TPA: hypothetical protein VKU90_11345 [Caulobacteraceae bacterium]|nr:hypothetical protein [Caulobacteraceae bacterium]
MNPPTAAPDTPASPMKALIAAYVVGIVGMALAVGLFWLAVRAVQARHLGSGWIFAGALVYGAAILGVTYAANRAGRRFGNTTPTPAARRYRRRFFVAMTAYVFTLMVSASLFAGVHPPPWLAWPLALAPAAAIIATIVVMGLYLSEETDELERAIVGESALWATGALLAIATTWGFLEQFGLVAHVEAWAVFPLWALCLGPASALVRRRYL